MGKCCAVSQALQLRGMRQTVPRVACLIASWGVSFGACLVQGQSAVHLW